MVPLAPCQLQKGPRQIFVHEGRKHFSKETLLKAKGWPREIVGDSEGNALAELRAPRNQEENHTNCECL